MVVCVRVSVCYFKLTVNSWLQFSITDLENFLSFLYVSLYKVQVIVLVIFDVSVFFVGEHAR